MKKVSLTARIVGAIVILSLGIIFIPVLLETNNIESGGMSESPIPEIPNEISTIVFQMNDSTGKFEAQGESPVEVFEKKVRAEIENSANEVENSEVSASVDKPSTKKKSQHTWMLQVASFKDKKKALRLRDKLRNQDYVTRLSERKQDSGSIWRVRIGPDFDKSKIERIQTKLDKEMGLIGLILQRR